jgi:hypothetical protein
MPGGLRGEERVLGSSLEIASASANAVLEIGGGPGLSSAAAGIDASAVQSQLTGLSSPQGVWGGGGGGGGGVGAMSRSSGVREVGHLSEHPSRLPAAAIGTVGPSAGSADYRYRSQSKTASSMMTANVDTVRITVEDTGVGLSDEAKERLFRPFSQAQRFTGTMTKCSN